MKISKRFLYIIPAALAACVILGGAAAAQTAQRAQVAMSYLPQTLVAAPRGDKDIPVEVELIFRETGGASVRFNQLNRSFIISNGMTKTDPVSFIDKKLSPGAEDHEDVTVVIPSSSAALCLGAMNSCDMIVRLEYSGLDERGNTATASLDILVLITQSAAAETFAVGDVAITSPGDGAVVAPGKASASGTISVTGVGGVAGQWLLNGEQAESFSKDVMGEGEIMLTLNLPDAIAGKNTLALRVTQPVLKESRAVSFSVAPAGKPAGDVASFHAGVIEITKVTSKQDAGAETRSGEGTAVFAPLGLEIPVTFQGLTIIDNNGRAELAGGQIIADVNKTLERGPLHVTISQMLIASGGAWADGSATLEASSIATGVGPLYFYALPFNEKGVGGPTKMEKPQHGAQGKFEATVDNFDLNFCQAEAALKVGGLITRPDQPGWKMPLSISVSFGDAEK